MFGRDSGQNPARVEKQPRLLETELVMCWALLFIIESEFLPKKVQMDSSDYIIYALSEGDEAPKNGLESAQTPVNIKSDSRYL